MSSGPQSNQDTDRLVGNWYYSRSIFHLSDDFTWTELTHEKNDRYGLSSGTWRVRDDFLELRTISTGLLGVDCLDLREEELAKGGTFRSQVIHLDDNSLILSRWEREDGWTCEPEGWEATYIRCG